MNGCKSSVSVFAMMIFSCALYCCFGLAFFVNFTNAVHASDTSCNWARSMP